MWLIQENISWQVHGFFWKTFKLWLMLLHAVNYWVIYLLTVKLSLLSNDPFLCCIFFSHSNNLFLKVSTFATYQLEKVLPNSIFILVTSEIYKNIYSTDLFLNISLLFYLLSYKIIRTIDFQKLLIALLPIK